ncbi:TonB-dependent receptor; Outer membrane receptor for ferrienterochelin and colicins [hydrothermal vent metagenome]|uniref:TonB-dependent receptor Outer membrane receptor for ferrienterochelin and colicins n=1 Tax=hydrothermal vent metagenome TaxID=652676 RepID=A0A3B1C3Q9_9ZZZZ
MKRLILLVLTITIGATGLYPAYAKAEAGNVSLGTVTVTGTREEEPKAETSATVDIIGQKEIDDVKPAHPSDIMNRIPGVRVNITGGEGHMTAIRQPLTTSPVYLYLEDGIPTRSTGFFNHNALYEVNVPMAGGIEVTKGPGTSLYGSDAIGGIINVLTRPAPLTPSASVNLEAGAYGWKRALLTGGNTWGSDGIRADLNITHTDGWRDATDYDRQSGTIRWDSDRDSGATIKSIVTYSNIDQQTAGTSRLSKDDYENNPTKNYTPISYREVEAFRASLAYEKESKASLVSVTPYYRHNRLEYLANWSLSYDPSILETKNDSFGLLAKYRKDFEPYRTRIVIGADIDHSPGKKLEKEIDPVKEGKTYTNYTELDTIYDYDATFTGFSPYLHAEFSPTDKLRISAGLRYDVMSYDYGNNLSELQTGKHRRPGDTTVDYEHLSPKVGATYAFTDKVNGFVSYRHAFRVPSEGQLFRQGKTVNTVGLDPVKVDSYEVGLRAGFEKAFFEISYYYMTKKDDILSYRLPDGSRETRNAGETLHKGVEVGADLALAVWANLGVSFTYTEQTFEDWKPNSKTDYSGNEMTGAPKVIANTRLNLHPSFLGGGSVEFEWVRIGKYWMDDANTEEYDGHDLLNIRASYKVGAFDIYGRVMNVTDERWATAAAYNKYRGSEYAPGMPLSAYAGVTYHFGK